MQNDELRQRNQSTKSESQALPNVQFETQLFSFNEIREFQQDNSYITHGYRANLTAMQCLKSAFILSNELVNIWTHGGMIPLLIFTLLYDQIFVLPPLRASLMDHILFLQFMLCCLGCSTFSAAFHVFNCHKSVKVASCCYSLDLFGITLAIIGIYGIGLYYGFYCIPVARLGYTCVVVCMMIATARIMLHPRYLSASWRPLRVGLFSFLATFGFLPIWHWFSMASSREVQVFLPDVVTLYSILGIAMFFYITRFPEKLWPGQFNFVGHSHNWWHILISIGFFYMRSTAFRILDYRLNTNCTVSE